MRIFLSHFCIEFARTVLNPPTQDSGTWRKKNNAKRVNLQHAICNNMELGKKFASRHNKNKQKTGIKQNNNGKAGINTVFKCLLRSSALFCGVYVNYMQGQNRPPQIVLS